MSRRILQLVSLIAPLIAIGCQHAPPPQVETALPMAEAPAREAGLVELRPGLTAGDEEMREALAPFAAEVAKLGDPIAETAVEMQIRTPELGNFVVDRMLQSARETSGKPVQGAFTNLGGIRASLPKGPISYISISQVLPFENTIVIVEVNADQFREIVKVLLNGKGNNPIAGFTVEVNEDWSIREIRVDGEPLQEGRIYTLATNNYLASGGGSMDILKSLPMQDLGVLHRDAVVKFARAEGEAGRLITPPTDNERYIIPDGAKE